MARTLADVLLHWADRAPGAVFVGEPERGRTWTYGQVADEVACLRGRLRARGVGRGEPVALLAENGAAWVVGFLGILAHGAIAVPIGTRHVEGDLGRLLARCAPAAVFADPHYTARLPADYRARVLASSDVGRPDAPAAGRRIDGSEAEPAAVGLVCFTSGTTGEPRGVMIGNDALVRSAETFAALFQSSPDSATAVVCPLSPSRWTPRA